MPNCKTEATRTANEKGKHRRRAAARMNKLPGNPVASSLLTGTATETMTGSVTETITVPEQKAECSYDRSGNGYPHSNRSEAERVPKPTKR